MNKGIKAKWVAALRSGKYEQTHGALRDGDKGFCCMGVLCNLHAIANPKFAAKQKDPYTYDGKQGLPSRTVTDWAGISETERVKYELAGEDVLVSYKGNLKRLSALNDEYRLSFKQIANIIDRCL